MERGSRRPHRARGQTYASAGVNVSLGDEVKRTVGRQVRATFGPEVIGSGFFGSMFQLRGYREPVLVSSVDGVGTKLKIASLLDRNDTVGIDIVNHCVNDILCCGAAPLFFLDYIAVGRMRPAQVEAIVAGLVKGCLDVGCSLIGGETAEMPGIYSENEYDLAGFIVGAVEKDAIIDGSTIAAGDVVLGLPSTGLHTNGYSLARKVFGIDTDPACLNEFHAELGRSLGDELLRVHRCYYPELQPALPLVKGLAHVTGGGFAGNIPRILPEGLRAHLSKGSWQVPPVFRLIQRKGDIEEGEMYRVFNMGIGMTIVCAPGQAGAITGLLPEAMLIGEIVESRDGERVKLE